METLTKPAELNRDTVQTLDEIRAGADNPLYGAGPDVAEELFGRHIRPLLDASGMSGLQVMHYGWFLRELARLWRTRTGRDLAFNLEMCIRKWLNLGLETNTVQFLVTEIHLRLKAAAAGGQDLTAKAAKNAKGPDSPTGSPGPARGPFDLSTSDSRLTTKTHRR